MNAIDEDTASAVNTQEPRRSQFLRIRGRSRSPPLKNRVIVYDCDQKTIQVKSEDDVIKSKDSNLGLKYRANCEVLDRRLQENETSSEAE